MSWVSRVAEEALMKIAESDALGVYATACRFELQDAAQVAARMSLRLSVSTVIESLMQEGIHGECLRALLDYRQSCCTAPQYLSGSPFACDTCAVFSNISVRTSNPALRDCSTCLRIGRIPVIRSAREHMYRRGIHLISCVRVSSHGTPALYIDCPSLFMGGLRRKGMRLGERSRCRNSLRRPVP